VEIPQRQDLDFAGNDTLYGTHGLHSFAAKCPPPLARWGIETYSAPNEKVLDPMAGSGTTLVEARLLGRHSIGADIDPLARLIATVKATPLDTKELRAVSSQLIATVEAEHVAQTRTEREQPVTAEVENLVPAVGKWFLPSVSRDLALLKQYIHAAETTPAIRRFLWVAFSSLILARTSVANARDIVHSRHHYQEHTNPPDVLAVFRRRLTTMQRQMADFVARGGQQGSAAVLASDIRCLPLVDNSVDLVFTSPPYGTALDYTRAHQLAILWLQDVLRMSAKTYAYHGRAYIGTERAIRALAQAETTLLSNIPQLHKVLQQLAQTDEDKALALTRYFIDMERALTQMGRVVKPGRHIVLVVCPSHIRKIQIPTDDLLIRIAHGLRFPGPYRLALEDRIERTLDDRRRVLPYMTEAFGQRMRTEYVIVWRKVPVAEVPNAQRSIRGPTTP